MSTVELHRLFDDADYHVDTITVAPDEHLILPRGNSSRFGNHSCDPNLWWDGAYDLITRRAVRAGEELTNDYSAAMLTPRGALPGLNMLIAED